MKKTSETLFEFASATRKLTVTEGEIITTPLAQLDVDQLLQSQSRADQNIVICGMFPFDPHEESYLIKPTSFGWEDLTESRDRPKWGGHNGATPSQDYAPVLTEEPETKENNTLSREHYQASVRQALKDIENEKYCKIVLSRTKTLRLASTEDSLQAFDQKLFEALRQANPLADTFLVRRTEQESWIGASPEIVSDVQQSTFTTHPLAGSLNRQMQPLLAKAQEQLFHSSKDLKEHAFVVDHIRQALDALPGVSTSIPSHPSITTTDTMWHLGTRISATVPQRISALEIAKVIHPTPAVCGVPTDRTLERISELEKNPRSFYSGLVGWMDARGNGRWSLILRCTRRKDRMLTLFAGAGIVKDSLPELELAETEAKMQTIVKALSATTSHDSLATSCSGSRA